MYIFVLCNQKANVTVRLIWLLHKMKWKHLFTPLFREYPEIISDRQRRQYRRDFDSSLARYTNLCKEMDDICDQIHKLGRELDSLDKDSIKYQVANQRKCVC